MSDHVFGVDLDWRDGKIKSIIIKQLFLTAIVCLIFIKSCANFEYSYFLLT